mgnify:CR=1 FL=1
MELYTKESLKEVIEKSKDEFYMPKVLFDHYKSLRLETKLAYVSILETMKNKAGYTTENTAYIKVDNPQIQVNLAILANKEVDQEKVNKYLNEIKNFSEEDIVYIDETGIQGYIYREYARAIRGKKVYDKIMDSKFFEKWFKEMFLNEVEKNKAIVMDNATFHCKSRL